MTIAFGGEKASFPLKLTAQAAHSHPSLGETPTHYFSAHSTGWCQGWKMETAVAEARVQKQSIILQISFVATRLLPKQQRKRDADKEFRLQDVC